MKKAEPKIPIADEMFLPNHSGDHSAGRVMRTPSNDLDIVNKKFVDDEITTHTADADAHHAETHTILSHDTDTTGAELTSLADDSMADTLHRHSELSASDGSPDPALSVDTSGNVGIGMTNPTADKLVINGGIDLSSPNIETFITRFPTVGPWGPLTIRFKNGSGVNSPGIKLQTANTAANYTDRLVINTDTDSPYILLNPSGGNVGIGTTNPDTKLHVAGNVFVGLQGVGTTPQLYIGESNGVGQYGLLDWVPSTGLSIHTQANAISQFFIANNGNVGIGTTSPDTKLQVVGDCKFGDDNTNYASFATDGELSLVGTARVYKNLFIRASALGVGGANPASETVNASGFGILEFADAADDYAQVNINTPLDMDLTAACEIKITWSVPNTSANMTWGWGYCICGENEDTEAAPTTGTTVVTSSATADGKTSDVLFTIAANTLATGDLLQIYFYRDVSEDTYSNPVDVHGMALKYTANKLGVAT